MDQIDDLQFSIPWLAEANLPLPAQKWLKLEAWVCCSKRPVASTRCSARVGLTLVALVVSQVNTSGFRLAMIRSGAGGDRAAVKGAPGVEKAVYPY